MVHDPAVKHFLDTSLVFKTFFGTSNYRNYIKNIFLTDNCYISKFIQMEFRRSELRSIIDFYFKLRLPMFNSISDGINYWANRQKQSELKAFIHLIGNFSDNLRLDLTNPRAKPMMLRQIERYIIRIELKLKRKFKDIGKNSPGCVRACIVLPTGLNSPANNFTKFLKAFNDVETCQKKCHIQHFIFKIYNSEIDKIVKSNSQIPENNSTRGFKKIIKNLEILLEKKQNSYSCKMCEKIGDAIIALNVPRNMQLEHVDKSFDYLCPPINQLHHRHPYEILTENNDPNKKC